MSSTGAIELVCFDLGGVLVRICTVWPELCRAARLDVRGDTASEIAERARWPVNEAYMRGDLSTAQWVVAVGEALGGLYTAEEIATLHAAVIAEEYPGIGALIDDIHRAGIATACLSNTNDAHWAALAHRDAERSLPGEPRYPSVPRLGSLHASHLMRLTKPAPAIYRAFETATGRSGSQILFFDDLPENVAAARTAGWRAETIDPTVPTDAQLRRHLAAHGVL